METPYTSCSMDYSHLWNHVPCYSHILKGIGKLGDPNYSHSFESAELNLKES